MRFIHFADAHIGVTTHGRIDKTTGLNDRVLDFLESLDFIVDYVHSASPDAVLFAGDAFHNSHPLPIYVSEFALRIKEMAEVCPVVLIPGNHDFSKSASALDVISVLGENNNVIASDEPTHHLVRTKSGNLSVGALPWPRKSQYVDYSSKDRTDDQLLEKARYMAKIAEKIEALAEASLQYGEPSVLLAHLTVGGSSWKPGQITTNMDSEVMLETLLHPWDYVALGHIHHPQNLTEGLPGLPPVVYPGSIERIDFGEYDLQKGFYDVSIGDDATFVEIPNVRPMVTLEIDARGKKNPHKYIEEQITKANISDKAILRIMIDVDQGVRVRYMDVEEQVGFVYRLTSVNVKEERADLARLHPDDDRRLISMSSLELLDVYFEAQGVNEEDRDSLLDLFEELNPNA
jgi:exonuclease SbcD